MTGTRTRVDPQEVERLVSEGLSQRDIARRLGVSDCRISVVRRQTRNAGRGGDLSGGEMFISLPTATSRKLVYEARARGVSPEVLIEQLVVTVVADKLWKAVLE